MPQARTTENSNTAWKYVRLPQYRPMNKTNATTQAHINQKQYIKVRQSQGRIQPLSRADITEGESAGQDPMGLSGFFSVKFRR